MSCTEPKKCDKLYNASIKPYRGCLCRQSQAVVILLLLCLLTPMMGFLDVWCPQQYQNDQMPFPIPAVLVPGCLLWFAVFVPPQAPLLCTGEGQGWTRSTPLWLPPQQDWATARVARRAAWGEIHSCSTALLAAVSAVGWAPQAPGVSPFPLPSPGWLGIREWKGRKEDPYAQPPETLQCLPKNIHEDCIS